MMHCIKCFVPLFQVAQVLLTLPYSFSQLGLLSGILLQLFYGLMGSWTAYLISILYVEYRTRKEREKVDFRNHVIQVTFVFRFIFNTIIGHLSIALSFLDQVKYYRGKEEEPKKKKKKAAPRKNIKFRFQISVQWFEVLDGLLGKHWRNIGLFFNCTFLLFGSVIQLIACAR